MSEINRFMQLEDKNTNLSSLQIKDDFNFLEGEPRLSEK